MKFLVVFSLSIIVVSASYCDIPCTKEMHPVCGTDGAHFQVFSNECIMKNQRCRDGKAWLKSELRSCTTYTQLSREYQEPNLIEDDEVPSCLKPCTILVMPVCGFDGTTYKIFGNECAMSNTNCLLGKGKQYVEVELAKCGQTASFGRRRALTMSACPLICPANYVPTCGFNGAEYTIFGNDCAMSAFNCLRSESWQAVSLDMCPTEYYV